LIHEKIGYIVGQAETGFFNFVSDTEKKHKKDRACFCDVCQEFMEYFDISEDELK